jgi:hypothetical protein
MRKSYSRTVYADLTITMSKPFANPTLDVELQLPGGAAVRVSAATLNSEYARQQAAYAAEATVDAQGVVHGPAGNRRDSNRIRFVYVGHLVTEPGDSVRPAA